VTGFDLLVEEVRKDGDSSPGAFRACAAHALVSAMKDANPRLLEPVMRVEVIAPDASVGQVLSDLTVARRAAVKDVDANVTSSSRHVIHADVPLSALLGYATALRSVTQGEGSFSMEFSHYAAASDSDQARKS
jgi:elongation factor G